MGDYVNPGFRKFQLSLNSEIYVDKSELIVLTNSVVDTKSRFVCISRPRRFGKTMAANMLAAYYGNIECGFFSELKIASHPSYEKHLNQYNVIQINVQEFLSKTNSVDELLSMLQAGIVDELTGTPASYGYFGHCSCSTPGAARRRRGAGSTRTCKIRPERARKRRAFILSQFLINMAITSGSCSL